MTDKMFNDLMNELGRKVDELPSENEMIHLDYVVDLVVNLITFFEERLTPTQGEGGEG